MAKAYATKDREHLLTYNAWDCLITARAFAEMWNEPDWNDLRVRRLYEQHVLLSQICAEMHVTGFPVHAENRASLAEELEALYDTRERHLLEKVGIPEFRCTPNDLRSLIFARHATAKVRRFDLPDPMDPRLWSSDEFKTIAVGQNELLVLLSDPSIPQELREIVDLYWQAESAWKARSTFVTSDSITQAIGPDGRLRAGWNSAGTDTGRFSCSEPNLMNIPDKKEEGALSGELPSLRRMYWAGPGNVLVHADKSQLELRIMYAVAKDEVLGAALASGDVYTEDAKEAYGLPPHMTKCDCKEPPKNLSECAEPQNHVKGKARKAAKGVHLGFQYGAGTPTVHSQMLKQNRTQRYQETALLHEKLKKRYHQTVRYWQEEHARVCATGYSESRIMHRRRVYPREPPPTETANYPIQATAADVMNVEIINLWRALKRYAPKARLVAQVHDAVDILCPERDQRVVEDILRDCMDTEVDIEGRKYRLPIDVKAGVFWSDV